MAMERDTTSVLLIEDNPGDARLIGAYFEETDEPPFNLGLGLLGQHNFDIILLDPGLPDSQGLDTLSRTINAAPAVPIVLLTGLNDKTIGLQAVRLGAQDYLIKGHIESEILTRVLRYAIERKKAENYVKASLAEKEVLLKEVHHRVKNNMQVIASLLQLQSTRVVDPRDAVLFRDSQDRIKSMALVYNRLYKSDYLSKIGLRSYATDLVNDLFHSYSLDTKMNHLNIQIDDIDIEIDLAIPCGLIINEVMSNSLKYAFPGERHGTINVSITARDEMLEMLLADDGVGLPEDLIPAETRSLGIRLIYTLAEQQLGGKVELKRDNGTQYRINIPLHRT
jgi:two-component sensor histidine kinase